LSICATGNYFAGALWPPVINYFMQFYGWRATMIGMGIFLMIVMLPLAFLFRRPAPLARETPASMAAARADDARMARPFGLSPNMAQILIAVAGVACCVAMSMPQVHIVAYCSDLGYGVARGAEMLSIMMAFGIVSRLVSGYISDKIGGLKTLLIGSFLQGVALALYVIFDGLTSLYVVSALFGLFQGGIVPSYALIVREYFPAREAATRVSIALTATMLGMALGGWLTGVIFDWTGSYDIAFLNGLAWNFLNLSIAVFLLMRARGGSSRAAPAMA
jgi:MFS family permease